ncbi:hypothetical protein GIB67_027072 [Kingdonia uniflora]|uniref:C2H2-type domain-containing protein n=1 Tax=Kingdonia uniflora TaxID=39325 RepID=A0A7J7P1N8_9MAGN|nr:hypothetical protein GIB67_027072 [Kingdonia uniflora]
MPATVSGSLPDGDSGFSSENRVQAPYSEEPLQIFKKRKAPGNPDPDSEVIALSPRTLMTENRFICEVCEKGFQREQNLQLHRRGHNISWKLNKRDKNEPRRSKVYVCPVPNCAHHDPRRAIGDITGIKKHYLRKHGEKIFKCEDCTRSYAVLADLRAHLKICGTKDYTCQCGSTFTRKDFLIKHRIFCKLWYEEVVNNNNSSSHLLNFPSPPHSNYSSAPPALAYQLVGPSQQPPHQNPNFNPIFQNPSNNNPFYSNSNPNPISSTFDTPLFFQQQQQQPSFGEAVARANSITHMVSSWATNRNELAGTVSQLGGNPFGQENFNLDTWKNDIGSTGGFVGSTNGSTSESLVDVPTYYGEPSFMGASGSGFGIFETGDDGFGNE